MKLDLLALTRHEYAKQHPDRDPRAMPVDDALLALADAVAGELDRMDRRIANLESRLTAKDAE